MDERNLTVRLRSLEPDDSNAFARWASDTEFRRRADWDLGRTTDEYRQFHRHLIESSPSDLLRLGVVHRGALIGYVDLHGDEPHRRELGFVIGERSCWGRGLGRSAAAAGLTHGFSRLALHEIWAETMDTNEASLRILRRLGMAETGQGGNFMYMDRPTHSRQFQITAESWLAEAY